ncbi:hypothetical protein R4M06_05590 [Brachyspira pilosicoli]|uniref:hypothetical protein n=1 Tax=Brachyspira pilosicoli TaxID=52584 RepID=UPI0030060D01
MKTKEILIKIFIVFSFVIIISIAVLGLLGIKERVGFLSDFNLNIDKTLYINGLDINETKKLFTLDDKLDYNSITNYIFTNDSITNYSYDFRIKYYSKVFRNSDIYDVYPNIENILNNNNFIKEIKMGEKGSPFGDFISSKIIYTEKIDNINYTLKLKYKIILSILITLFSILVIFIFYFYRNKILLLVNNIRNFLINDCENNFNISIIVFIIFFPFIFFIYNHIRLSYYYYYMTDSTNQYTKDMLLVSLNMMPEHLLHPNMIPLVLFKIIFIPFGKFFNILTNITLEDFKRSLNPYFIFAEMAEYSITICYISFLLFLSIMFINGMKIINKYNIVKNKFLYFIISILMLIFFMFPSSIGSFYIFNALINIIRYETFGLLFASISLFFIILSSETKNCIDNAHKLYIIIAGIFSGFAILSKIQLAGWAILIFIIYILLNLDKLYKYKNENNNNINYKNISILLIIFTIALIIFNFVIYKLFITKSIKSSYLLYDIDPKKLIYLQSLLPISFVILTAIISLIYFNKIKISYITRLLIKYFVFYILAMLFPLILSLLLPNPFDSLANTYILSYAGGSILSIINWGYGYGDASKNVLKYLIIFMFLFILILMATMIFIYKKKKITISKTKLNLIISILILIISILFMNTIRKGGTDFFISVYLIKFSILLFFVNLLSYKKYNNIILLVCIILLSINMYKSLVYIKNNIPNIFVINNNIYYNQDIWKSHTYSTDRGTIYTNIMEISSINADVWNSSFYWSKDIRKTKSLLSQTYSKLTDVTVSDNGAVISKELNEYISSIDKNISGGLLLILKNNDNYINLRPDYDFYFVSDIEYKKEDERINFTDYDFYINDKKYFVYKLNMKTFQEIPYGYDGSYSFKKGEDFMNRGFILIIDRLAKGL